MAEFLCRACNRCKVHCACDATQQELDLPYPAQLESIRMEWRQMGVRL